MSLADSLPTWPQWRALPLQAPFAPLAGVLSQLPATDWPLPTDYTRLAALDGTGNARGKLLRFVPASPDGIGALAFERRILEQGEVETRAQNWHDAFHACAWLMFPRAKARINALHVQAGAAPAPNGRSPLRDLLTLFDESGLVVACAQPELTDLLAGFRWHELFWTRRGQVTGAMDFTIFGHALYERCHALFDGVTAKAIVVPVATDYFRWDTARRLAHLDAALADLFGNPPRLDRPDQLQPLPVKGIPGWAPENLDPAYYLDERQFRPGRLHRQARRPAPGAPPLPDK